MKYTVTIWITKTNITSFTLSEENLLKFIKFCKDEDIEIVSIKDV